MQTSLLHAPFRLPAEPVERDLLAKYFRVLGDPTRLRILGLVAEEERSVGELAELLAEPQPKVSNHLACLRWCGFVVAEKDGRSARYRIVDERVHDLLTVATGMMADNAQAIASCLIVGEPMQEGEVE